ncbi:MAG: hypothetical protein ACXADB_00555 [Candidatus Hermodarchaeia archaeon]
MNTPLLSNPFYTPLDHVLIKGAEENGKWIVYLQASNEMKDQDGEIVEVTALKKAADYFLSHGIVTWDHKQKVTGDPGFIIGEPLDVKFTNKNETLVKGFLYKSNDIAQKVWKNIKSGARRIGASIGGGILQKAETTIKQVVWDEAALTHKPVNDGTLGSVQLVPFAAFAKALTAGSGVNAAMFSGGRALTPESLQGSTTDVLQMSDIRAMFSDLLKAIRSNRISNYNDMLNFVYDRGYEGNTAARIVNYIARKIPNVVGKRR